MVFNPSQLTVDDEWFRLSSSDRDIITLGQGCEGVVVFGQTGGAKTSSLKTAARQLLMKGLGGIVFCVKKEEYTDWLQFAKDAGREKDVVDFSPGKNTYNFINAEAQYGTALIENVVSVILDAAKVIDGKAGNDTWDKAARQLMRSLITVIISAKGKVTIDDMYACIANMPKAMDAAKLEKWNQDSFLGQLIAQCKIDHPDLEASLSYILEEWPTKATETSSSVEFTLSTTIDTLRRAPLREWLCGETTIRPEDARNGKIIIVNYPVLEFKEAARLSQIIFKTAAQRALERVKGNFVFFWCDEYQYLYAPGDTEFATTRRSNKIIDVILLQNLPLWKDKAGADGGSDNRVMAHIGNMNTKIFLLNDCTITNKYAAEVMGRSIKMRKNVGKNSSLGGGKYSSGQSSGESEQWDYDVQPHEFGSLMNGGKDFDFYTSGYVRQSRLRTWSNGKKYFKVIFDQKIGQRKPTTALFCFLVAFVCAVAIYLAQDVGLIPPAVNWLLPNFRSLGRGLGGMVAPIYQYNYYLTPLLTLIGVLVYLNIKRKDPAR